MLKRRWRCSIVVFLVDSTTSLITIMTAIDADSIYPYDPFHKVILKMWQHNMKV